MENNFIQINYSLFHLISQNKKKSFFYIELILYVTELKFETNSMIATYKVIAAFDKRSNKKKSL